MTEKNGIEKTLEDFRESMKKSGERSLFVDQKFKEFDTRMNNATTGVDFEKIRKDFDEFRESQN